MVFSFDSLPINFLLIVCQLLKLSNCLYDATVAFTCLVIKVDKILSVVIMKLFSNIEVKWLALILLKH